MNEDYDGKGKSRVKRFNHATNSIDKSAEGMILKPFR